MPVIRTRTRSGFTLAEVAISTLVLVVAALVVLMLLPSAVSAQQDSRYKSLAAMHAQTLIDNFVQAEFDLRGLNVRLSNTDPGGFTTAPSDKDMVETLEGFRHLQSLGRFDLEHVTGNRAGGNYPVPIEIARRLDSPGNEIQEILDSGGYIYYADPLMAGRLDARARERSGQVSERGDMQRLVWGVVGPAQHNLATYNPAMVPQGELYPFPPTPSIAQPTAVGRPTSNTSG